MSYYLPGAKPGDRFVTRSNVIMEYVCRGVPASITEEYTHTLKYVGTIGKREYYTTTGNYYLTGPHKMDIVGRWIYGDNYTSALPRTNYYAESIEEKRVTQMSDEYNERTNDYAEFECIVARRGVRRVLIWISSLKEIRDLPKGE